MPVIGNNVSVMGIMHPLEKNVSVIDSRTLYVLDPTLLDCIIRSVIGY